MQAVLTFTWKAIIVATISLCCPMATWLIIDSLTDEDDDE